MNNDLCLYILMRTDLESMRTGRACAQASHASNSFIHRYGKLKSVKDWTKQTIDGFGTAIVLGVSKEEMMNLFIGDFVQKFPHGLVQDPEYGISIPTELLPYLKEEKEGMGTFWLKQSDDKLKYTLYRQEYTCMYIFGDREELKPLLGNLPLYS